jgi:hypothetical protein
VALLALAVSFSGRISEMAVWIVLTVAWIAAGAWLCDVWWGVPGRVGAFLLCVPLFLMGSFLMPRERHTGPGPVVLHLEPEHGTISSKDGIFLLSFVNTGPEDIDHIHVLHDYFEARTTGTGISIRPSAFIEFGDPSPSLKSKHRTTVKINSSVFGKQIDGNDLHILRGVRLTVVFRRAQDGKEFYFLQGYGFRDSTRSYTLGSAPDSMHAPFLPLRYVAPYFDSAAFINRHNGAMLLPGSVDELAERSSQRF